MIHFVLGLHGSGYLGFIRDERILWDEIIMFYYVIYAIMLVVQICVFLYGYRFELSFPELNTRDDRLRFMESNFRSWTQHFEYKGFIPMTPGDPAAAVERYSMGLRMDLAAYLVDPEIPSRTEFALSDQISLMVLGILLAITAPSTIHPTLTMMHKILTKPTSDIPIEFWIFGLVLFVIPALFFSIAPCWPRTMKYYLWECPGRLGRAMRMRSIVKDIRNYCLFNDTEKGEGNTGQKLKGWIEKLLEVDHAGLLQRIETALDEGGELGLEMFTREERLALYLIHRLRVQGDRRREGRAREGFVELRI